MLNSVNINFVNKGSDYELLKSLNKQGLVQKDVHVQGKYGTYMRKQWVSAGVEQKQQSTVKQPIKKDEKSKKVIEKQYFPIADCDKNTTRAFAMKDIIQYHSQHKIKQPLQQFIRENYFISDGDNKTIDLYRKDGKYTKERQKLHDKIVKEIVDSANGPKKGEKPVCILMGGGSASGKGTLRHQMLLPRLESVGIKVGIADPDDIKEQMPEYKPFKEQNIQTAAARVHRESSDINREAINALIDNKKNFMWDGTMKDIRSYLPVIEKLKKAGYHVQIVGADVPTEMALERSHSRAKRTGRDVPDDIIASAHGGFANTFPQLIDEVDEYYLYDNSGEKPVLIQDTSGVKRPDLMSRFQKKAQDYRDNERINHIAKKNNVSRSEIRDLFSHGASLDEIEEYYELGLNQ